MPSWFELARWFQRRKSCKWGKRLHTAEQQVNVAKNVDSHQWPMGHVARLETVRCDPQNSFNKNYLFTSIFFLEYSTLTGYYNEQ